VYSGKEVGGKWPVSYRRRCLLTGSLTVFCVYNQCDWQGWRGGGDSVSRTGEVVRNATKRLKNHCKGLEEGGGGVG